MDPMLPLDDDPLDGACLCVSVQYRHRLVDVFREVCLVLRPDAPFIVSFSRSMLSDQGRGYLAVVEGTDQERLVTAYMQRAGFGDIVGRASIPREGDPLWMVVGIA
jgi:hypothetical protein